MLKEPRRTLISCREAAEILGCTMGRIRQLARNKQVWSKRHGARSLVLDRDELKRLASLRQKARDAGAMPGPPAGGFSPDT